MAVERALHAMLAPHVSTRRAQTAHDDTDEVLQEVLIALKKSQQERQQSKQQQHQQQQQQPKQ